MKNNLLRYFIGLTFLSAGVYRIFNWQDAVAEFSNFSLSGFPVLIVLMVILEIVGGVMLILNIKTKYVLRAFVAFIIGALISAFMVNGQSLLLGFKELFVFSPTPTDFFLHFTYLIILIYLLEEFKRS